jgi:hypothetical protein
MGVESCLVLAVFRDECCHPNRFRVELMLVESFEIGRLDFPKGDSLKATHWFLPDGTAQVRRATNLASIARDLDTAIFNDQYHGPGARDVMFDAI